MEEMFVKIQSKSRKKIFALVIFFMTFEAIFIFPLKYELSILNAVMIYCYLMLGFVLCAVTRRHPVIIFLGIVFSNMVGHGLRIWLEWGEYSMIRDLTLKISF